MKPFRFNILLVLVAVLSVFTATIALTAGNPPNKPTERKAFVRYGNDLLLEEHLSFDFNEIKALHDSIALIQPVDSTYLGYLKIYLELPRLTKSEVVTLIDSLFEAPQVPLSLINQINLYLTQNTPVDQWFVHLSDGPYPADEFYNGDWNTTIANPYKTDLVANDSTIELLLQGNHERLQQFVMPVNNVLTSPFGWRDGRMHKGIDIDLEVWDTVRVAFPGEVRFAKYYGNYGRLVVVRHYNGLETYYAHLHRIKVKPGDKVNAGDLIGLGGSSGRSSGSHLHFEMRYKGLPIDPLAIINKKENTLVNDTLVIHKTPQGIVGFPKGAEFHVVKRGEYLYAIAMKYGLSLNQICQLNSIKRNKPLYVGQRIRII